MLNEEEKKAIEYLTKYIHWETLGERSLETDISTVLNLITKLQKENKEKDRYIKNKDKQIDLMAEIFYKRFKAELLLEYGFESEEQLKQYFERKVEDVKD